MTTLSSNYLLKSLISGFSFGINNILFVYPGQKLSNLQILFYRALISLSLLNLFILIFVGYENLTFPKFSDITNAVLINFGLFAGINFLFASLKKGKAGLVGTVFNSNFLFTLIYSSLILGISSTLEQVLIILLMLIGVILVSINFHTLKDSSLFKFSSGLPQALIGSIIFGVSLSYWSILTKEIEPLFIALIIEISFISLSFFSCLLSGKSVFIEIKDLILYKWSLLFLGLSILIGTVSQIYAYGNGPSGLVSAIIGSSSPIAGIILASIFFKERLRFQEYLGVLILVIGIAWLSLA